MSWGCCTPRGECRMGPGCPAGVLLDQPSKPAARNGTPNINLRRVQLVAAPKRNSERALLAAVLASTLRGLVAALALVGFVFTLVFVLDTPSATPAPTHKPAKVTA